MTAMIKQRLRKRVALRPVMCRELTPAERTRLTEQWAFYGRRGWDEASFVLGFCLALGLNGDEATKEAADVRYPLLGR